MEQDTFDKFVGSKSSSPDYKEAFYHHLMGKYNGNPPSTLNLENEWVEFILEYFKSTVGKKYEGGSSLFYSNNS